MVAVSVFSLVMVVAIGAVLAIVSANRKAQALNSVITNLNFAIEGMVRDLRTGFSYDCGGPGDGATDCPHGTPGNPNVVDSIVSFYSAQTDDTVTYGLSGDKIYKDINSVSYNLTSGDIKVSELHFYVSGTEFPSASDYNQPRILIIVKGSFIGFGAPTEFKLQSMVSQRKLDI